ncbi:hypothetical protein BJ912DRAFT_112686 [Pholiota molesta]|nr:hypothetical protein BJ912DRAFT_112686 [Pholiota molesta]
MTQRFGRWVHGRCARSLFLSSQFPTRGTLCKLLSTLVSYCSKTMSSRRLQRIRTETITDNDDASSSAVESNRERCDRGMALLRKHISKDAFQDLRRDDEPSSSLENPSETDQAVLERIKTWLQDAERRRKFLWIGDSPPISSTPTGPIAHPLTAAEIEEICRDGGIFGASFSFSRRTAATTTTVDQADAQKARMSLIPTLAYQLAHTFPQVQQSIAAVRLNDPAVFMRSLASQILELIVKPLRASPSPEYQPKVDQPKVVLIEGLSSVEGNDTAGTKEIVDAISQCLQGFTIPIGFILVTQTPGGMKMPKRYARVTR